MNLQCLMWTGNIASVMLFIAAPVLLLTLNSHQGLTGLPSWPLERFGEGFLRKPVGTGNEASFLLYPWDSCIWVACAVCREQFRALKLNWLGQGWAGRGGESSPRSQASFLPFSPPHSLTHFFAYTAPSQNALVQFCQPQSYLLFFLLFI